MKRVFSVLIIVAMLLTGVAAFAADYPTGQISMILGASPGGLSDTTARTIGALVSEKLGVPVVYTNKPGASHAVAMSYVQASKSDGYTIGFVPVEMCMVESLGFATDLNPSSFEMINTAFVSAAAIAVPASAPYNTLDELFAWCKENPGQLDVGNSGTGSIWHVAAIQMAKAGGIEVNHIPYDGASDAVANVMGGHIDAVTVSEMEVRSGVESGDLKILGIMSDERSAFNPDVPTCKELGYDLNMASWGGFVVPKGTPEDVLAILREAFAEAVASDTWAETTASYKFNVLNKSAEEFETFAMEQYAIFQEVLGNL